MKQETDNMQNKRPPAISASMITTALSSSAIYAFYAFGILTPHRTNASCPAWNMQATWRCDLSNAPRVTFALLSLP